MGIRVRRDPAAIIQDACARAGLTQADLARAAGTSHPTSAAYESGAKSPSVRTQDKIVRAAGFSLDAVVRTIPPAGGAVLAEVRARQADTRRAAAGYGIRTVRVVGSAARRDARPDSDIDLLVDFDAERHGLGPLAGFLVDVRDLLDRDVDVATLALLREDVPSSGLCLRSSACGWISLDDVFQHQDQENPDETRGGRVPPQAREPSVENRLPTDPPWRAQPRRFQRHAAIGREGQRHPRYAVLLAKPLRANRCKRSDAAIIAAVG